MSLLKTGRKPVKWIVFNAIDFADEIGLYLAKNTMTVTMLARKCEIDPTTLYRIYNKEIQPTVFTFAKICTIIKKSPSNFFTK